MPLVKVNHIGDEVIWGLWKITESTPELLRFLSLRNIPYELPAGKSAAKLRESIAARVLAQNLAEHIGLQGGIIRKDDCDCPFWAESTAQLSLSHTTGFAAAIIHRTANACGIDIEFPHERIRKIAPRVFTLEEIAQANDLSQLTLCWCAKEALYKWHKVGSLDFRTQLNIRLEGDQIYGQVRTINGTVSPLLFQDSYGELVVAYCWL
ncbi:4'-phosphopantetheinyl transferase family protein [Rhodoflexus sp.]